MTASKWLECLQGNITGKLKILGVKEKDITITPTSITFKVEGEEFKINISQTPQRSFKWGGSFLNLKSTKISNPQKYDH